MTEVKTDNELIAEFMGQKVDNGYYVQFENVHGCFAGKHLRYHNSWEWLMPVLEKIQHIEDQNPFLVVSVAIRNTSCRITYGSTVFKVSTIKTINSVYRAAVSFIKYYNSINEEKK